VTPEGFDGLFDMFHRTAFRLECLQSYAVAPEDEALRAFRQGLPRPERSVRTSPWLRRVALTTAAGKQWSRVHLVRQPLSEYLRYELIAYQESQAAGEQVLLADLDEHPDLAALGPDFWLFDSATADARAVLMHYDDDSGDVDRFELVTPGGRLSALEEQHDHALRAAVPLNTFLARQPVA